MHTEDSIVTARANARNGWGNAILQSRNSKDLIHLISRRVLLAYSLLVGFGALLFLGWEINDARKDVVQRHEELYRSVESVLTEAVWTFNGTVLDSVVRGLTQDANITGARIRSREGGIDVETGILTQSIPGWSGWLGSRHVSRWPIVWTGDRGAEEIGILELETSEHIIEGRILQRLQIILLFSGLALGSFFFVFLLLIRRHVVTPLTTLTRAMGDFRLGEASRRVEADGTIPDEIEQLYEAFHELDTRLQAAHGSLTAAATEMERQLAEQAASLDAAHKLNMSLEVTRAQEVERRRLLRDMHDGFGSELVSARIAAERGNMGAPELATVLTKCIADLQLMISVTGTEAGNLAEAIADWRYRVSRQLKGEQFRLAWSVNLAETPALPQRVVLQILRIAQEAVLNATRHSGAKEIRISAQWTGEEVVLTVADDGDGLPLEALSGTGHRGKGLASMGARARELGAALSFCSAPGCTVRLSYKPLMTAYGDPG